MQEEPQVSEDTETIDEVMLISVEETIDLLESKGLERLFEQKANGIVNPIVLAKCLGVRPQMIYNYIRNGRITAVKQNSTQKLVITWDEAIAFAQKYLNRKLRKEQKAQAELEGQEA